jgi:transcriptional regulator with XRE-family HTH domain
VTNIQEARNDLGKRLRELRLHAGLTGKQLAESLSWPPSKVSKLENGRQTPTDDDIRSWTRTADGEDELADLLASLHTLELQYGEWRRILRMGLQTRQRSLAELEGRTRLWRVFEPNVVPGLLQTAEYARARFAEGVAVLEVPNDIDEAVHGRIQRQAALYSPGKRFHFLLTEAALRFRLCAVDVMLGQLDRLVSTTLLPNIRLGVIGFETQFVVAPWHGFWLLDDARVIVETYSAELNLAQQQEVGLYARVFDQLAAAASYGHAARGIITRVTESLASESHGDGE